MSVFNFAFSGDDIEEPDASDASLASALSHNQAAETGTLGRCSNSAFPIAGQPLLPPQSHNLTSMFKTVPSKIAYSTVFIKLDDGSEIRIPRRELWDVRIQLMAEDDDEGLGNLGKDDVKTGVYEGGFKSWESSVDLVKALHRRKETWKKASTTWLELGCGTALPSLAICQWLLAGNSQGHVLGLADYNPTVLRLVTLPNLVLSWVLQMKPESFEAEGELEIDALLRQAFLASLDALGFRLHFFSGAWSPEFVQVVAKEMSPFSTHITIVGAETIYSPFALRTFATTLLELFENLNGQEKTALVAAKKVYFGVGGSMEDFCDIVRAKGFAVDQIREESDGVRRTVVAVTES